jgi:hypothetical protein
MISNGFGMPLSLLEKIEERYSTNLEKVFNEPPVGFGKE